MGESNETWDCQITLVANMRSTARAMRHVVDVTGWRPWMNLRPSPTESGRNSDPKRCIAWCICDEIERWWWARRNTCIDHVRRCNTGELGHWTSLSLMWTVRHINSGQNLILNWMVRFLSSSKVIFRLSDNLNRQHEVNGERDKWERRHSILQASGVVGMLLIVLSAKFWPEEMYRMRYLRWYRTYIANSPIHMYRSCSRM